MYARLNQTALVSLLLIAVTVTGCAVSLPRIDPQGRSILLPQPNYTQLQVPGGQSLQAASCLPKPAWVPPVDPDPCPEPQGAQLAGPPCGPVCGPICGPRCGLGCGPNCKILKNGCHLTAGEKGKLQLTPQRLVARVGTEIVLRSGVCGEDGCLVTGQPVEWILTQDSVGHLVGLGGSGRPLVSRMFGTEPQKITDRFAVTHTSTRAHLVTRGTPTPADDVPIKKGEGWISVTSPREGVSYVTAIAPKAVDWGERRETAIIHWIDAKWELPSPASVRTTQEHELITRVLTSDGEPQQDWIVRYEIETGPQVEFSPGQGNLVEVATDNLGESRVNVRPLTEKSGVSRVKVEIVRPADRFMKKRVVGRGWTTIRWSAPALQVDVSGPTRAELERPVQYLIRVTNPGDLTAKDVMVSTAGLPRSLEYVNSMPAALRELTDGQEWRLGDIQPGQVKTIEANYRLAGNADSEIVYQVRVRDGDDTVRAEGERRTSVFIPSIRLDVLGPAEAEVGQEIQYEIKMTNTGRKPLSKISIQDSFDAGLRHIDDARSPIDRDLNQTLAVGASTSIGLTFVPVRPGYFCHTVTVLAEGGQQASERVCLTVRARPVVARPDVEVRLVGPAQGQVDLNDTNQPDDNDVQFRAEIKNSGNVPLTNVIVEIEADSNLLSSKEATIAPPFELAPPNSIRWTIDQIGAGDVKLFEVRYNCQRQTRATSVRVLVTADDEVRNSKTKSIEILPPARQGQPPAGPARPAPGVDPRAAEDIEITIFDQSDGIRVNEKTVITIQVDNNRSDWDGALRLFVTIPPGLELDTVLPGSPAKLANFDGRILEFQPVATVRPGEKLRAFRIRLRGAQAGEKKVNVEVRSNLSPDGVTASETVNVTP